MSEDPNLPHDTSTWDASGGGGGGGSAREARWANDVDRREPVNDYSSKGLSFVDSKLPPREGSTGKNQGGRGGGGRRSVGGRGGGGYREDRTWPGYAEMGDGRGVDHRGPPPLPGSRRGDERLDSWGPPPIDSRDDRRGAPPPPIGSGGWGVRDDGWGSGRERPREPPHRAADPHSRRDSWGPPPARGDDRDRVVRDSWGPPPVRSGYDDYGPPPSRGYYDDRDRGYDRGPPPRGYYDERDRGYYRERSPPPRDDYYDRRPPPPRDYDLRGGPPPLPRDAPPPRDDDGPRTLDTRGNNGLIVGPQGRTVKQIEHETGANVKALPDKTTVEIYGPPDAIRRAVDMILDLLDSKSRDGGGGVGGDVFSRLGGSGKRGRDEDPYDQYANRSAEKRPRDSLLEYLRRSAREAGVAKDFPPEPIDSSQVVDADGNVTASADITNYIGLIIGKSGRMQSEIQSITGLTMEINRETNTATFTGPLDQVEQGLSLIREVIETTNALREVRVGAPSQHRYDERSGRGGDLDRPREERPPRAPEPLREGEVAETLPITGHVGLIIGKQGANIKWMKKKSSCSIEVNREEETVDIRGSPDNVALAKRLIAETLEKSRNRAVAQQGEDEQMPQAESTETAE